jgi:hypothetical protein
VIKNVFTILYRVPDLWAEDQNLAHMSMMGCWTLWAEEWDLKTQEEKIDRMTKNNIGENEWSAAWEGGMK